MRLYGGVGDAVGFAKRNQQLSQHLRLFCGWHFLVKMSFHAHTDRCGILPFCVTALVLDLARRGNYSCMRDEVVIPHIVPKRAFYELTIFVPLVDLPELFA